MPTKQLQVQILKRFMSAGEYEKLVQGYKENTKAMGSGKSRKENLDKPITDDQLSSLKRALTELETPIATIAKDFGVKPASFHSRVERTALMWVYQNVDLDEL